MKPFDLERALAGDPVVTRDGRHCEVVGLWKEGGSYSLIVGIGEFLTRFTVSGMRYLAGTSPSDLFMAPKKRTVWVNLYPGKDKYGFWYESEKEADRAAGPNRIDDRAYPVEIED